MRMCLSFSFYAWVTVWSILRGRIVDHCPLPCGMVCGSQVTGYRLQVTALLGHRTTRSHISQEDDDGRQEDDDGRQEGDDGRQEVYGTSTSYYMIVLCPVSSTRQARDCDTRGDPYIPLYIPMTLLSAVVAVCLTQVYQVDAFSLHSRKAS
jgi:hypothetical protein